MERITIIGLSPIGISMGLALKSAKLKDTEIIGTSGDRGILSAVKKMGAVDDTEGNLRAALRGAQLVVVDVPFGEMREMLQAVGPALADGCVVTDTTSTKVQVLEWAEQSLPMGVSFVGGHPLIKQPAHKIEDSTLSLFQGIDYCLMPSPSADSEAVKTVVGLTEMLNARPLFLDPQEHDSYTAAMSVLPVVASAAMVGATAGSDAWREMHKLAAAEFNESSALATTDPLDSEARSLAGGDKLVYWIDQLIAQLYSFRSQISDKSDELMDSFVKAWEARTRWEIGAVVEDASVKLPGAGESMAAALFGERLTKRYQQMTDRENKKPNWRYRRNG